jgi:hypothetical protein
MLRGATGCAIEIVKVFVADCGVDEESLTFTAKLNWPDWVGVPLMVPVALRVRPGGNEPELMNQL